MKSSRQACIAALTILLCSCASQQGVVGPDAKTGSTTSPAQGDSAPSGFLSSLRPPQQPQIPATLLDSACAPEKTDDKLYLCGTNDAKAALNYCHSMYLYYQNNGRSSTYTSFDIGLFGTLAGSVFAVTTVGTAAKAWAGLSGAANAAQSQYNGSSLGASASVTAMTNISANMQYLSGQMTGANATSADGVRSLMSISASIAAGCSIGEKFAQSGGGSESSPKPADTTAVIPPNKALLTTVAKDAQQKFDAVRGKNDQVTGALTQVTQAVQAAKAAITDAARQSQVSTANLHLKDAQAGYTDFLTAVATARGAFESLKDANDVNAMKGQYDQLDTTEDQLKATRTKAQSDVADLAKLPALQAPSGGPQTQSSGPGQPTTAAAQPAPKPDPAPPPK